MFGLVQVFDEQATGRTRNLVQRRGHQAMVSRLTAFFLCRSRLKEADGRTFWGDFLVQTGAEMPDNSLAA